MEYLHDGVLDDKVKGFITSSIETSFNVKKIDITSDKISVEFEEDVSEEKFIKIIKNLLYISKSINRDVLFENKPCHEYNENPMSHLEACKDVIRIADGMFLFQGIFWKIFKSLHEYVKNLAKKYNAIEQEYPTIWPIDLFRKIDYFKEFPQLVFLTTNVKDGFDERNNFSKLYNKDNIYNSIKIDKNIDNSRYGLAPAVCDPCYYALENTNDIQNNIYTSYNKVFRHEFSKTNSLDRLQIFSMREIIFVGDKNFVLMTRQRLIDDLIELLKYLNLDSKIETANDPFFSETAMKSMFQYVSRLKYELLAKLNYSDSYLAVGSINFHLDFFGRAFNIKLPDRSYMYSGCIGIGFERLVYALYCQYGHKIEEWPKDIRNKLNLD